MCPVRTVTYVSGHSRRSLPLQQFVIVGRLRQTLQRTRSEKIKMTARIYRPSRTATQSGIGKAKFWLLEFEPKEARRIDPLMGWTGSGDMARQVRLNFSTKEEAITYAEKNGLSYLVEEAKPTPRKIVSYSDNFKPTRIDQWTH